MTSATPPDPRVLRLTALLQLEQEARQAGNNTELAFVIVNESHRLVPYHQAALWRIKPTGGIVVEAVSGVSEVEAHSPFVVWLRQVVKSMSGGSEAHNCHAVEPAQLPPKLADGWNDWTAGSVAWVPLIGDGGNLIGGIWISREQPWQEGELTLLERAAGAYAHAAESLTLRQSAGFRQRWMKRLGNRWVRVAVPLLLLAAMFFPVRLSVLAPADVVPTDPLLVSSPLDGVVKTIHVKPNQEVKKGQLLYSLDDATLASRNEVAKKALAVAEADYLRAAQKAFSDAASKAELAMRKAEVDQKLAEVQYTEQLLQRLDVRAPSDGIVVFSDANDWLGRPVSVGEKIMTVADPARTEVEAWVPVGDAINLEPGAELRLFLNTDPTNPLPGRIYQTSYEAKMDPNNVLAFLIKAKFAQSSAPPRIGLKGTAKIYGEGVTLGYYLLRRPLATIRQFVGL